MKHLDTVSADTIGGGVHYWSLGDPIVSAYVDSDGELHLNVLDSNEAGKQLVSDIHDLADRYAYEWMENFLEPILDDKPDIVPEFQLRASSLPASSRPI